MKTNLTTRMVSLILAIVLLVGVMPTAAFAIEQEETTTPADTVETVPASGEEDSVTEEVTEETEELPSEEVAETTTEPVENEAENVTTPAGQDAVNAAATAESDVVNVTNGKTFTMQGKYLDLLHNHSEYGVQDYLISEWQDEIRIYFMEGDVSNITFKVWDSGSDSLANSFGVRASTNVWFMSYIYDKNTLTQIRSSRQLMPTTDMRIYSYSFAASFDIYKTSALDGNFKEFFYDASNTRPGIPDSTIPEDVETVTYRKTFTMQGQYLKLLQSHNYYGTRDYIASEWQDEIRFYFFEDISNVEFSVWDSGNDGLANSFGARPSRNVWAIEYVYDKDTLIQKRSSRQLFSTSDARTYSYSFVASFDIYDDDIYGEDAYFYDHTGTHPGVEIPNLSDLRNETNGRVFTLKGEYVWLIINHSEYNIYGTKKYLAYEWGNEFIICFFDDISGVFFTIWDKQGNGISNSFGINASREVQFTEYVYDKTSLRLKSVNTRTTGPSNMFEYSYQFTANFDIYVNDTYGAYFYMVGGDLPNLPPTYEEGDKTNDKFHMDEVYCNKIKECPEYQQGQRYLSYLWSSDFVIWFFDDPNVQFSVWDRRGDGLANYFGVNPSMNTKRKAYVYDRNTLALKYEETVILGKNSGYTLVYDFVSNIDIYTDETYTKYFYKGDSSNIVPNTTNGTKFATSNVVYSVAQQIANAESELATKNYIAFAKEKEVTWWFFDDQYVKITGQESGSGTFELQVSSDTQVRALVYDATTWGLKTNETIMLKKSERYSFNYIFMANFDIYKNDGSEDVFYIAAHNGINYKRTFQPLKPKEAEEFLRFISQAGAFVNVKKKLPDYYNLLIGEIPDPEQEKIIKERFLIYFNQCMDIQMAVWEGQVNFGMEVLIAWLDSQNIIKEEFKNVLKDVYDEVNEITKRVYKTEILESVNISSLNDAADLMNYSFAIVNALGLKRASKQMGDINYLNATLNLLMKIEKGDETDIAVARTIRSGTRDMSNPDTDFTKMEKYAGYIFSIMQSLRKS